MNDAHHILIVEDDAGVAQGLIHGLQQAGFRTSLATNGAQGLERILHGKFDLVLLDLMLPKRTGFEVLDTMFNRASVPVIVLSALRIFLHGQNFESGAVDFVPKPFFMEELSLGFAPDWLDPKWRPERSGNWPTWSLISMLGWFFRTAKISG